MEKHERKKKTGSWEAKANEVTRLMVTGKDWPIFLSFHPHLPHPPTIPPPLDLLAFDEERDIDEDGSISSNGYFCLLLLLVSLFLFCF